MGNKQEYEKTFNYIIVFAIAVLLVNIYYYCHPVFAAYGLTHPVLNEIMISFHHSGIFATPYSSKAVVILFVVFTHVVRGGKGKETPWSAIIIGLVLGLGLFFVWPKNPYFYFITTVSGYILTSWAVAAISRNMAGFHRPLNDVDETFEQTEYVIDTPDSINLPIKFQYQQKMHRGWINVVNPFRAVMILGTPGSGKSFSVYNPTIHQMMQKDYTMCVYDYKFPDLSTILYNEYLEKYPPVKNPAYRKGTDTPKYIRDPKAPEFFVLNFNNPRYSHRCNPIHRNYISDPADTAEIAEVIWSNVSPESLEKPDFFSRSATLFVDILIYFLSIYKGGIYCTFPHLIELLGQDYKKVFSIVTQYQELETKIGPFIDALEGGAQDQLQGQLASAKIVLNKMSSPALYWVLSGDDFTLDINEPDEPKILCLGNDPNRQAIYGTVLALYTSRLFKLANRKHKRKCAILLDELPTIFLKGLDNLIATARSNKVAIVFGAQDKTQLIRDYTQKEADVIFNTVGTVIAGQVNGKTAQDLSHSMGKEYRMTQSQTQNIDSESIQISYHQEDIMPTSKIETLSQGVFFGKVADNNKKEERIKRKFFCGEIDIDVKGWLEKEKNFKKLPLITTFGDDEIRQMVHESPLKEEIIDQWAVQALLQKGTVGDAEYMEEAKAKLIDTLDESQIENILNEHAEELIEQNVKDTVQENYDNIKRDIRELIREELPLDEEEDDDDDDDDGSDKTSNGGKLNENNDDKKDIIKEMMGAAKKIEEETE